MTDDERRDHVRHQVSGRLSEKSWNPTDLQRASGVDAGTIGDFLSGKRWPRAATRSRLSIALGWTPDSIDAIFRGGPPTLADHEDRETVAPTDQDSGVLLSLPPGAFDGLSPADREEVIAAAKAAMLERAREIRRRLDA